MRTRSLRRLPLRKRIAVGAVLALAAAGGIAWAATAGADTKGEPAAFAQKGILAVPAGLKPDAPASLSIVERGQLVPGKGKANGRVAKLGGGDEVLASLDGGLVPLAVENRAGSLVAYSSWHELAKPNPKAPGQGFSVGQPIGIPSIRVYDGATGKDKLLANGAHSPALSADGRLAFMKGDDTPYRINKSYDGHVLVGSPQTGKFERWTTQAARYFPYAWAGNTLLVYKEVDGSAPDVYAYSGAGQSRLLAPEAMIVAVSPDASKVLVTVGRRMVEIVRVSDGGIVSSLALDGDGASVSSATTPHFLSYAGSWSGDRVVANSGRDLVVLNVANGIRIESVLTTPQFEHGVFEPTFTDATHVIGWADLASTKQQADPKSEPIWDHALVSCDLTARSCGVGEAQPARSWTRWVVNPSR